MKKWISLLMAALLVLPLNGNWFVRAEEAVPAVVYGDLTGDGQVSSEDALERCNAPQPDAQQRIISGKPGMWTATDSWI